MTDGNSMEFDNNVTDQNFIIKSVETEWVDENTLNHNF